ncbi:MAG: hypothetical protein E6J38_04900 [Chloroflexi bacterium]|nr:MAG: hypothetical protein E6J38_04900 [Chloroflexota bacterium]
MSTKTDSIAALEKARKAIDDAFAPMPDSALAYLKPGDDYAIGGIVIHLIQSLDGYIATLEALGQAGYRDTEGPAEDESVVEGQLAHARLGLTPAERKSTFAEMAAKQQQLGRLAAKANDDEYARLVGVSYPGDDVPYPTSVALVLQWMTEHFTEHVPHARQLFAEWQTAR